jgi:uncharacterized protein (DUF58 family)
MLLTLREFLLLLLLLLLIVVVVLLLVIMLLLLLLLLLLVLMLPPQRLLSCMGGTSQRSCHALQKISHIQQDQSRHSRKHDKPMPNFFFDDDKDKTVGWPRGKRNVFVHGESLFW